MAWLKGSHCYVETIWFIRIYDHFVQGRGKPPVSEYQRFSVHDEACWVMDVLYLWHKGGFPCPCTKSWLIIFPLPLLKVSIKIIINIHVYYKNFSYEQKLPTLVISDITSCMIKRINHRVIGEDRESWTRGMTC